MLATQLFQMRRTSSLRSRCQQIYKLALVEKSMDERTSRFEDRVSCPNPVSLHGSRCVCDALRSRRASGHRPYGVASLPAPITLLVGCQYKKKRAGFSPPYFSIDV